MEEHAELHTNRYGFESVSLFIASSLRKFRLCLFYVDKLLQIVLFVFPLPNLVRKILCSRID